MKARGSNTPRLAHVSIAPAFFSGQDRTENQIMHSLAFKFNFEVLRPSGPSMVLQLARGLI